MRPSQRRFFCAARGRRTLVPMRIGGFLLGAFIGAVLSFNTSGAFWLFGRFGYVLPAGFGIAGALVVRRLPGGRALSAAGFAVGAMTIVAGLLIAAAICWWIVYIVTNKHGWF
jgi:hypothetical protein